MLEQLLLSQSDTLVNFALFVVRVALGLCIVVHGLGKLGYLKSNPGGVPAFAGWLTALGMPFPLANAWLATITEFGGGILFTVGFLTRPVALALTINMLVAAATGHRGGGYLILNNPPGAEYAINLTILFAMFVLTGPGWWSLDYLLFANG
ncbi:MAG: DoxX family protein [Candidatus Binatia bacterium]